MPNDTRNDTPIIPSPGVFSGVRKLVTRRKNGGISTIIIGIPTKTRNGFISIKWYRVGGTFISPKLLEFRAFSECRACLWLKALCAFNASLVCLIGHFVEHLPGIFRHFSLQRCKVSVAFRRFGKHFS